MRKFLLTTSIIFFIVSAFAGRITGAVKNDKGEALPYASILVKGTTVGTTANNNGVYFIELDPGTYTIVCQYVGYTREEKSITVGRTEVKLDFTLPLQQTTMKEVTVKAYFVEHA